MYWCFKIRFGWRGCGTAGCDSKVRDSSGQPEPMFSSQYSKGIEEPENAGQVMMHLSNKFLRRFFLDHVLDEALQILTTFPGWMDTSLHSMLPISSTKSLFRSQRNWIVNNLLHIYLNFFFLVLLRSTSSFEPAYIIHYCLLSVYWIWFCMHLSVACMIIR